MYLDYELKNKISSTIIKKDFRKTELNALEKLMNKIRGIDYVYPLPTNSVWNTVTEQIYFSIPFRYKVHDILSSEISNTLCCDKKQVTEMYDTFDTILHWRNQPNNLRVLERIVRQTREDFGNDN